MCGGVTVVWPNLCAFAYLSWSVKVRGKRPHWKGGRRGGPRLVSTRFDVGFEGRLFDT